MERKVLGGIDMALDELLSLADGLLAETPRRHLAAARTRVAEDRFNLVVLGEFKRGKSTLINALLARDVLPTGVVPLTSGVTIIGYGECDRLRVSYEDGREEERPLDELAEYVTDARNPGNRQGVELARVEPDHELLRAGLELVDTPGIGSVHSHNTEVARGTRPPHHANVLGIPMRHELEHGATGFERLSEDIGNLRFLTLQAAWR
jgi:ribosome biogenesis GTPase A